MHHRVAVYLHHVEQALFLNRGKLAVLTEAGIVDQQIDLNSFFFGECKNPFRGVRIGEVRGDNLSADLVGRGKCARQFLEPVLPPRGQDQLRSAKG